MKCHIKYIVFILLISPFLKAESLWDSDFNGYLSSQKNLAPGDIIVVVIDSSFSFSHVSTQNDSKTITFEYSGGEYANLFSFLPQMKTGVDNNGKSGEEYSFKTNLVARVVSVEGNSYGSIEGSREVSVDSKKESITLTGYIDAKDIDQQRQIPFSKIADSRLSFQTFLYPSDMVLTENDIEEIIDQIIAANENRTAEGLPVSGGDETVTEGTSGTESGGVMSEPAKQAMLSKEKKMELFLKYVNRMIDVLFN